MNIQFSAKTDVGRKRTHNEDSFCAVKDIGLFIVADGMGGHAAGEVASQTTVEVIKMGLTDWLKKEAPSSEIFIKAIKLANKAVFEMAEKTVGMKGMGTTVTGILIGNSNIIVANVGDSRVYRIRNNSIEQLSNDHSMVGMQLSIGLITAAEAKKSKYKNIITRAIGTADTVEVDIKNENIMKNDLMLICSDGLSSIVDDHDILDTVVRYSNNVDTAVDKLIELANFNGGDDNITIILVKFT